MPVDSVSGDLHPFIEMRRHFVAQRSVTRERERQTYALRAGKQRDLADPRTDLGYGLTVLGEEYGEVCKSILGREPTDALYAELIQVAAVAVALAEGVLARPERGR